MNTTLAFIAISLICGSWALAQNVMQEPQEDPVQQAILEFNRKDSKKPNEVTVVLSDVGEPPAPAAEKAKPEPAPEAPAKKPVLVTGKPPEGTELVKESEPKPAAASEPTPPTLEEEPAPKHQEGLSVRVAKLQAGTGIIDPSQVKLLAPFPAKPLAQPPPGWRLESSENAPPFTREVELSPGTKITLTIRPHLLVPEADGAGAFSVPEPGYDPSLGYRQESTIGAALFHSIRQLDDDAKELGNAVEDLQQLLVSLPKPEEQAPPLATPVKTPTVRKR